MKQPSWKVPLILATTVLALGSFSYWLAFSHKPKKEREETNVKKPLVIPSEDAQIVSFRLKSTKGVIEGKCTSLSLRTCKVGDLGKWDLTYPLQTTGDEDAIRDMILQFSNLKADETIDLTQETPDAQKKLLEEYGLSDQKRTTMGAEFFELTFENGKKTAIWFGENHPIGNRIFVGSTEDNHLNTKTVYLLPPSSKLYFDKSVLAFRDKTIFHFDKKDVDQFTAKVTSGKLEGKMANNTWTINGYPGDHDRIETLIATVVQAKAKDFLPESVLKGSKNTFQFNFHTPKETIAFDLYFKTIPPKEDDISNPTYYLKVPGRKDIYEVEFLFRNGIDKSLGELRESALLKQTEKLTATTMTLSGKNYKAPSEFHYDGKNWTQKDSGQKLDAKQIASFIDLLISSHAKEIVVLPKAPELDSVTFSLGDDAHPTRSQYRFFATKDGIYAQDLNQKASEAYLLDPKLKSALPFSPDQWKIK